MCGIYGFIGKKNGVMNEDAIIALGLFNMARGIDSCGYYYNGNIVKGVNSEANFGTFISNQGFKPDKDYNSEYTIFLGHNRKTTIGKNIEENAHPFKIENYVQTHNGVIRNVFDLKKKYEIKEDFIVDSENLAYMIKHKGYEVLEHYEGFAALAFTYTDKPDCAFLYHGKSPDGWKGEPSEERPLFLMLTPDGYYYSSMLNSLVYIQGMVNGEEPKLLPHNKVIKVKEGKLTNIHTVDRINTQPYTHKYEYSKKNYSGGGSSTQAGFQFSEKDIPHGVNAVKDPLSNWYETTPPEKDMGLVYVKYARYMTGDDELLNGLYRIDRDGRIIGKDGASMRIIKDYYFIRGVMMRDKKGYDAYLTEIGSNQFAYKNYIISKYSKYPVCTTADEAFGIPEMLYKYWFHDKKKFSGRINMKFTKRTYYIKDGLFDKITSSNGADTEFIRKTAIVKSLPPAENPDPFKKGYKRWVELIDLHNDVRLLEQNIPLLDEPYLVYLDYINDLIIRKESDVKHITDSELELTTTLLLKDLIKTRMSLKDFLKQEKYEELLSKDVIYTAIKDYSILELDTMESRYMFIDFNTHGEEKEDVEENSDKVDKDNKFIEDVSSAQKEEVKVMFGKCVDQLHELEKMADNLQVFDLNELAQVTSFNLYNAINELKQKMDATIDELGYNELRSQLTKITCG